MEVILINYPECNPDDHQCDHFIELYNYIPWYEALHLSMSGAILGNGWVVCLVCKPMILSDSLYSSQDNKLTYFILAYLLAWIQNLVSQLRNIERQKLRYFISRMTNQDNKCVISRLITEGSYDLIINKILTFLDFQSFVSCGRVCSLWRSSIKTVMRRYVQMCMLKV